MHSGIINVYAAFQSADVPHAFWEVHKGVNLGFRRLVAVSAVLVALLPLRVCAAADPNDDLRAQIQEMKQQLSQMDDLKARLAVLEKRLDDSEKKQADQKSADQKPVQPVALPAVTTSFPEVKAKLDGRIFVGVFASGAQGTNPNWSTNISDAKLRFSFIPSDRITVVTRLNASGAQTGGFDYFYLDYSRLLSPTNTIRLGQRKIDFGQETWVDSPEEDTTISPSVSDVSGYATGIALVGKFNGKPLSPLYEAGFMNGPKGLMVRPTSALPYNIKVGTPFPNNFFASMSYYNTGKLGGADNSALSVASLVSAPTGARQWERSIWEADLRYNCDRDGLRRIIPWDGLPNVMLGATYGVFSDSAVGAPARNGTYWFVDGLLKLTPKLCTAARYSVTGLNDDVLATLGGSPVPVNFYDRTTVALLYRLSGLSVLKTEYDFNHTIGGASQPSLNQWIVGVASRF